MPAERASMRIVKDVLRPKFEANCKSMTNCSKPQYRGISSSQSS
ncbi:MAG: hypothetical protein ACJAUP_001344 [Cellvibrionaceae bacterium]|jgi:hypothetical protein